MIDKLEIDFYYSYDGIYEATIYKIAEGEYLVIFCNHCGIGEPTLKTSSLDYATERAKKYCNW